MRKIDLTCSVLINKSLIVLKFSFPYNPKQETSSSQFGEIKAKHKALESVTVAGIETEARGMENLPTKGILQSHHFQLKLIFVEQADHLASWFVAINCCANGFTSLPSL